MMVRSLLLAAALLLPGCSDKASHSGHAGSAPASSWPAQTSTPGTPPSPPQHRRPGAAARPREDDLFGSIERPLTCPRCYRAFPVRLRQIEAGESVTCPRCGQGFDVPPEVASPVARMRDSFEQARAAAVRAGKDIDTKLVRMVKGNLHLALPKGIAPPAPPPHVHVPDEGRPRRLPEHPIAERILIGYREAVGSFDREEEVDILGFDARRNTDGSFSLTGIIAYSHDEERRRRFAVRHIVALQAHGEPTVLTHHAPIMVCLRALAGLSVTEEDKRAAILEAGADTALEYADEDAILAKDLRLDAWIDYTDKRNERTRRRITITSIHGYNDPEYGWEAQHVEAFCHQRQAIRTFMVCGMKSIAESEDALQPMSSELIEYWLRMKAGKSGPDDKRLEWELANPKAAAAERAGGAAAARPHPRRCRPPGRGPACRHPPPPPLP